MKKYFGLLIALGLSSVAMAQPTLTDKITFDQRANGIDQKLNNQIPLDLKFKDENGKDVTLADYFNKGRPIIMNPVWYECTGTCELTFSGLITALNAFKIDNPGDTYDIVTFSIKPTEGPDLATVRKQQVKKLFRRDGVDVGWHFLTGDLDSITKLTAALGFRYQYNQKRNRINHPSGIMIATPEGKVAQYLYGVEYPAPMLLRGLEAAKSKKIAPPAPVINLGCYEFDPTTNSYRPVLWRIIQLGGVATFVILAGSIAFMSFKYRTQPVRRPRGGKSGSS